MITALVALHTSTTLLMSGVIWFVQVVHYPLMARVGPQQFAGYEHAHVRTTTALVFPLMILEVITAAALWWWRPDGISDGLVAAGLGLLIVVWASTFLLQVPCHRALAEGFDSRSHRRLLRSNWIRVIAWSGRSALVLWMLAAWIPEATTAERFEGVEAQVLRRG